MMNSVELFGFMILCSVLCGVNYRIALKWKVFSSQNFRREFRAVPLLGGLGLFFSLFVISCFKDVPGLSTLLVAGVPLLIVGLVDDLYELRAKYKTIGHALAVVLWLVLSNKLNFSADWGVSFMILSVGTFWVITMINAVNMIDGVDGQASLFGWLSALTLGLYKPELMELCIVVAASILGFLSLNLPKAKQFLGEVGSSFIGFVIAVIGMEVVLNTPEESVVSAMAILFLCAFPCVDLCMAIFRRVSKKLSPFQGDQEHIHHRLQRIGLSPWSSLAVTGGLVLFCATTGYLVLTLEVMALKLTIGLMSTGILLFILAGVCFCEHQLGLQMSGYGTGLLQKHLRFDRGPEVNVSSFGCVVIDFLPYYKTLQRRGLGDIESFVADVGSALANEEAVLKKTLVRGHLMVLFYDIKASEKKLEDETLFRWFFEVTQAHNIMKNETLKPEGVEYYSSRFPGGVLRLLKVLEGSGVHMVIDNKELAS